VPRRHSWRRNEIIRNLRPEVRFSVFRINAADYFKPEMWRVETE
jgi:hypothetical protein